MNMFHVIACAPIQDKSFDLFSLSDVEKKLNESLRQGDFDAITEQVTPKILASCKTNALLKAFEVSLSCGGA